MPELVATDHDCLSDLELDEWLAGELAVPDELRCHEHSRHCASCRQRKLTIEQTSAAFHEGAPSFEVLSTLVEARAPRRYAGASKATRLRHHLAAPLAVACAALLAFVVTRDKPAAPGLDTETRAKGAPRLSFFLKRGGSTERMASGASVRPGDLLRFVYSTDRPYYVALMGVDAHSTSVYYPSDTRAVLAHAGQDVALNFSVELDDTPGRELVIAWFCPEPFEVALARGALITAAPLPAALASCRRVEIELNKLASP